MSKLDKRDSVNIEGIAKQLAQGRTIEQISADTALDIPYITWLTGTKEFAETFKLIDPDKYKSWQEDQKLAFAAQRVKSKAKQDAEEWYDVVADLIRTGDIPDTKRADLALKLLDKSGEVDDTVVEERVTLSESVLDNISEALRESKG